MRQIARALGCTTLELLVGIPMLLALPVMPWLLSVLIGG